eukprot:NODE_2565_length_901_cov_142.825117_g2109_i0.p1 GENE.NODE_2565_length_901_cov_142.825117_g2109_i0~~NODE_2565_length_901_cov_142.825117_g2109_i0.p1  ORF type:complete len:281 (+),score=49.72 NODE_2565_length_901_cov_142.825117_g2109_i0:25-843(+)
MGVDKPDKDIPELSAFDAHEIPVDMLCYYGKHGNKCEHEPHDKLCALPPHEQINFQKKVNKIGDSSEGDLQLHADAVKDIECWMSKFDSKYKDDESMAVTLYTSNAMVGNERLYSWINNRLRGDQWDELHKIMFFVRALNTFITTQPSRAKELKVYRVISMNLYLFKDFEGDQHEHHFVRFQGYTSFTTSLEGLLEKNFTAHMNTLFEVELRPEIKHACYVSHMSWYPAENEVLFVPHSRFKVLSATRGVERHGRIFNEVRMMAVDNKDERR